MGANELNVEEIRARLESLEKRVAALEVEAQERQVAELGPGAVINLQ